MSTDRDASRSAQGTTVVPPLLSGLVHDAAVFPPGSAPLDEALAAHRTHRSAWYAPLVGPLLVPAEDRAILRELSTPEDTFAVGLVADLRRLRDTATAPDYGLGGSVELRLVEAAVAKRGEDPQPGLADLLTFADGVPDLDVYAEIPLTSGLLGALDVLARARAGGARITPKFRTGGLAAELFPTPRELATVICECRDRGMPFKLTAGLHRAMRHNDPDTGFTHHGFLNILAATLVAADGGDVGEVARRLAMTDPVPVVEAVRGRRSAPRPLWTGFGSCSVTEPLDDLRSLGLLAVEVSA